MSISTSWTCRLTSCCCRWRCPSGPNGPVHPRLLRLHSHCSDSCALPHGVLLLAGPQGCQTETGATGPPQRAPAEGLRHPGPRVPVPQRANRGRQRQRCCWIAHRRGGPSVSGQCWPCATLNQPPKHTLAADVGIGTISQAVHVFVWVLSTELWHEMCALRSGLRELYLIHSALIIYQ